MAGHSKWKNIQYRKGAQDARRAKIFTKYIREITTAARVGGCDLASNPRLRLARAKALSENMTSEVIDRAIKRGVGGDEGVMMEEMRYEGYGPGGVPVLVECLTDNRNRTASEVRHAFSKNHGNLGTDGSVAFLFSKKGVLVFNEKTSPEHLLDAAIELGADDVKDDTTVFTNPSDFEAVKEGLLAKEFILDHAEVTYVPSTESILDQEGVKNLFKMIDALEDLDDVQNVYHNAKVSDEIMESFSQA